jgi:uncharacterized delta-60 repeat protein
VARVVLAWPVVDRRMARSGDVGAGCAFYSAVLPSTIWRTTMSRPLHRTRRLASLRWAALTLACATALVGCGGTDRSDTDPLSHAVAQASDATPTVAPEAQAAPAHDATAQVLSGLRRRALALQASAVPADEAARQLMDFAEAQFPQHFPGPAQTLLAAPFAYRYYPSTGVYLAVALPPAAPYVDQGVYVLGGAFGNAPLYAGVLTDFITPVDLPLRLALGTDKAVVLQGGTTTVPLTLTRAAGVTGEAFVQVDGLPTGVSATAVRFTAGSTQADLVLRAAASAPHSLPTSSTVTVVAGAQGELTVTRPLSVTVRGPAGSVDTSFQGGVAATPVDIGEDYVNAVAVQPDGKVVVVGSSASVTGTHFAVLRYLRDGGLDPSFGQGGKRLLPIGTRGNAVATAVALQPDGRIVVAGSSDQGATGMDFAVVRLLPDGAPDASFGQGGTVTADLAGDTDRAWALALQTDGRIVVGGQSNTGGAVGGMDFALLRLRSDGQLDTTFGQGGRVISTLRSGTGTEAIRALALPVVEGEQRILAVGGEGDFVLARYRANGSLDSGFGAGGKVVAVFNDVIGAAHAVTLQPDGRAVVAGQVGHRFAAIRIGVDGQLDAGFGTAGRFTHAVVGNWNEAQAVVRQADGKLVLGGWAYSGNSSSGDFAAIRLTASGQLDTGFAQGGVAVTAAAQGTKNDQSHALALQPDDRVPTVRVIQAGEANGSNHDAVVLRRWL